MQLFPLFFGKLLWLIYALYCILKDDFDTDFLPIILFIKIFVAENVAKSPAEWCRVAVMLRVSIFCYDNNLIIQFLYTYFLPTFCASVFARFNSFVLCGFCCVFSCASSREMIFFAVRCYIHCWTGIFFVDRKL